MATKNTSEALLATFKGDRMPKPEEFRDLVTTLDNHQLVAKVFLLEGTPFVFATSPMKNTVFREQVTAMPLTTLLGNLRPITIFFPRKKFEMHSASDIRSRTFFAAMATARSQRTSGNIQGTPTPTAASTSSTAEPFLIILEYTTRSGGAGQATTTTPSTPLGCSLSLSMLAITAQPFAPLPQISE